MVRRISGLPRLAAGAHEGDRGVIRRLTKMPWDLSSDMKARMVSSEGVSKEAKRWGL